MGLEARPTSLTQLIRGIVSEMLKQIRVVAGTVKADGKIQVDNDAAETLPSSFTNVPWDLQERSIKVEFDMKQVFDEMQKAADPNLVLEEDITKKVILHQSIDEMKITIDVLIKDELKDHDGVWMLTTGNNSFQVLGRM